MPLILYRVHYLNLFRSCHLSGVKNIKTIWICQLALHRNILLTFCFYYFQVSFFRLISTVHLQQRSQGILDSNQQSAMAISTYKRQQLNQIEVPADCCRNCGNRKHSDRKDCPAKGNTCSCGKTGHFRKCCYRDGKKKGSGGGRNGKKEKEESETMEENNQGIGETCCNLQSEHPTGYLWRRVPVGASKFLPPALSLPEEVTLASLVYSKGNNKWVDRANDEGANKLYVLIKPMLDQWAQLHEDPTCTPSKYKMKKTQAAGVADTGASVLCSGLNLMRHLGLEEKNLIKTSIIIMAANEEKMDVLGYIPVTVKVVGHPNKESTQALYITRQLKTLFISRTCLQELGCLPSSWPYPPEDTETCTPIISETLDEWLQDYFKSSTFNTWPPQVLPGRSGQESSTK